MSEIINGTQDNDSIRNTIDAAMITVGDGDDFIINGGYWESERGGQNVSISAGSGNDTIISHGSNSILDGGAGDDSIYNGYRYYEPWNTFYDSDSDDYNGNNTTILGGTGNDTINNLGNKVTINAGDGDDYVYNGSSASLSVIDLGAGDDSICNYGNNVTINAGDGDNSIRSYGENVHVLVNGGWNTVEGNVTINTGTSNSTLTGDRDVQVYQYGSGNDVITNYSGEDVIYIAQDKLDSYSFDGGDLIFHIGDGSIRLKNMTNHAITVKDSTGKITTKIYSNGYSPQQVLKNFVKSMVETILNNRSKLDEAIKLSSGFNSVQEVIDKMIADCAAVNDADTFLRDYCGIILDNDDRDAVVGWDAGGLSMKTKSDLFPQSGDAVYPESTTFTIRGLTITVPEKDTLSEKEQLVVQGFYSWWAEEAIKLIEDTFGIHFDEQSIKLSFFEDSESFAWGLGGSGGVQVNLAFTNFEESDKNGGGLGDYLFPHEMTHVLQGDFNIWSYMSNYMTEGMADLTAGNTRYMTALASDSTLLAQYLDLDNTFSSDVNVYAVGYMFWRYFMKQVSDAYDSSKGYAWKDGSSITGTDNGELLTGSGKNVTISAGKGNDTITVYGKNMKVLGDDDNDYILIGSVASNAKVYGGVGDDSIYNAGSQVKIYANDGNDSVKNDGSNVTISGYTGNDYIENNGGANTSINGGGGADTISNNLRSEYNWDNEKWGVISSPDNTKILGGVGDDSIYNAGSQVKIYANDGNDSVKNDGSNVTISGYTGNDYIENNGGANTSINGGGGADTISNNLRSEYNWDSEKWEVISSPDNVKIIGGVGDDSIENFGRSVTISGNNGDDTITNRAEGAKSSINGGAGNDSINNWAGEIWNDETQKYDITPSPDNVTIVGGSGNDTVYNEGSKISINGGANKDLLINGGYWESERGGSKVSIHGSSGNDTIISHGSKSVLNGGPDNDLIYNGYRYYQPWNAFYDSDDENYNGNDTTIIGGKGNDTIKNSGNNVVFKYTKGDGKDSIVGFNENSTLIISDSTYSTTKSNSDVIVKVGTGKITLAGVAELNKISIERAQTIADSIKSPLTLGSAFYIADASERTTKVKITGNKLDNTIIGSPKNDSLYGRAGNDSIVGNAGKDKLYGGKGSDTLIGGKGNDSLWGDAGADTFIYEEGDGKDIIFGFDNNDTLTLDGLEFTSSYKNNAITLKFSSGSVTFKDFTATTFHIDNNIYKISSSKLVKQ